MPTISVDRKDLERLAGRSYTNDELSRALEQVKAEIDSEEGGELRLQLKDTNRPDLWCCEGVARLLKGIRVGAHRDYGFFGGDSGGREVVVDASVRPVRPYVAAFACRGIEIDESTLLQLIEAQEKLAENYGRGRQAVAIGIYDASDIRFPVRYKAADPGKTRFVPLEADAPMNLRQILADHPTGRAYAHLLEGFDVFPLLTDDGGNVLSMPPVINSRTLGRVEVGDSFLFCEATGPELDPVLLTMAIMAVNMADRGGEVLPVTVCYPYDTPRGREIVCPFDMTQSMELELDRIERVAGQGISPEQVERALASMGYREVRVKDRVTARPAPYRDDLLHPVDMVEDVVIGIGYNAFEPEMPKDFTVGKSAPIEDLSDRVRDLLVGSGFQEAFLGVLTSRSHLLDRMRTPGAQIVEISNPMSDNYSAVRNSLIPGLLGVEAVSRRAIYPHRMFEVGEVSVIAQDENYGTRTDVLATVMEADGGANLSRIQSTLDVLAYYLSFEYELRPLDHPSYLPGRAGEIVSGGKTIGMIGELHPEVLDNWGVVVPVSVFEIKLQKQ